MDLCRITMTIMQRVASDFKVITKCDDFEFYWPSFVCNKLEFADGVYIAHVNVLT